MKPANDDLAEAIVQNVGRQINIHAPPPRFQTTRSVASTIFELSLDRQLISHDLTIAEA
jgi:hypothetical protein